MKGKKTVSHTHPVKNTPAQLLEESIHIANISAHCIGLTDMGVIILHPRLNLTIDGFLHLLQKYALPNRVSKDVRNTLEYFGLFLYIYNGTIGHILS